MAIRSILQGLGYALLIVALVVATHGLIYLFECKISG
jgi:hypothetical protein